MAAKSRLAYNGASRSANASYAGKAPAPAAVINFRRTISQLGTRAGERQVQANHNG